MHKKISNFIHEILLGDRTLFFLLFFCVLNLLVFNQRLYSQEVNEQEPDNFVLEIETEEREVIFDSWEDEIEDLKTGDLIPVRVYVIPARFTLKYNSQVNNENFSIKVSGGKAVVWQGLESTNKSYIEIFVAGNVRFEWGDDLIRADEAFYSLRYNQGIVRNIKASIFEPDSRSYYYVKAKELRILSKDNIQAFDALASLTPYALPWLHIRATKLDLYKKKDERFIKVTDGGLYVRELKVLPLPDFSKNIDHPVVVRDIRFNRSDNYGFGFLTEFDLGVLGYDIFAPSDYNVKPPTGRLIGGLDFYTLRGIAPWLTWKLFGDKTIGGFTSWYMHDAGNDSASSRNLGFYPLETTDRTRLEFWFLHIFPSEIRLSTQFSWWSDKNLQREFFESEFKLQKDRDTFAELSQYSSQIGFRLFYRKQINEFSDTTEFLPQLNLFFLPQPLIDLGGPLYFHLDTDISDVGFKPGADNTTLESSTSRFIIAPGLSWALDFDIASLVIRGWAVNGWYNLNLFKGWNNLQDKLESITINEWLSFRTDIALRTYIFKSFPKVSSEFFDFSGLKHMIMPEIRYIRQFPNEFNHGLKFSDITVYDDIDPVDNFDAIVLTLKNTLYANRADELFTFLNLRLEMTYFPEPSRDNSGYSWGSFYGNFEFNPFNFLSMNADFRYELSKKELQRWGIDFSVIWDKFDFSLAHRAIKDTSLISSFQVSWDVSTVYNIAFQLDYDFKESRIEQIQATVQRIFPEFALAFTFRQDVPYDETIFIFNFKPTGVFKSKSVSLSSPVN